MQLLELCATMGLIIWSCLHWIYICFHLLIGPLAAFLAYDKGYVVGIRGFFLGFVLFGLGPVGLLIAFLLRAWPGHSVTERLYPGAWAPV